ncbi:probable type IV pilus assembly FimV-related transmembrane protein [Vibrio astriarenae]|nr:probable type IV pilus assembly FimV-related transmembrane protein [Vibrio sp. C7]
MLSGGDWDSLSERDSSAAEQRSKQDTSKAEENEFGLPQDDDWLFESNEPEQDSTKQPLSLDEALFPEFTEEDTAASFDETVELEEQPEAQAEELPFALDDELFPEFTEEDAAVSFDEPIEPELQPESQAVEEPLSLDDELFPEFTEEDAAASFDEPVKPEPQAVEEPLLLDDELLPEFTEEDAAASFDEPVEPEPQAVEEPLSLDDELLPEFTEEDAAASFDELDEPELTTELQATEEPLSLADELLPEFTEEDAAASLEQPNEPLATTEQSHSDDFIDPSMAVDPENVDEQNALFDLFQSGEVTSESAQSIDEGVLNDWLDESNDSVTFDQSMFSPEKADSAGMDIDSMLEMGGEDWDGFQRPDENLADIPADEQQVWESNNQPEQAKLADDDWSQQHDFNPKDAQYKTIEELMAEVDSEVELTPDEEELNLNVGLDEFPDVIGNVDFEDVDANSEASGKIDLAKIYLEMNDSQGAIKLLEEAIVDGNDDIRREAKSLIDKIRA